MLLLLLLFVFLVLWRLFLLLIPLLVLVLRVIQQRQRFQELLEGSPLIFADAIEFDFIGFFASGRITESNSRLLHGGCRLTDQVSRLLQSCGRGGRIRMPG